MKRKRPGRPKNRKRPVRRTGLPRSAAGLRCPWSSSCFDCPKPDCTVDGKYYFNEILSDELYAILVDGKEE